MKYEARSGIVKMKICGVSFLTPTRKEMNNCSAIMPLNFFNSIIWQMLSNNKPIDEIYDAFQKLLGSSKNNKMNDDRIRILVDKNLNEMVEKGYVIRTEE